MNVNPENVRKALGRWIASLEEGGDLMPSPFRFSPSLIQHIRRILNIYSNDIPAPERNILVSCLLFPAPERAILRLERFLAGMAELPEAFAVRPEPSCILATIFSTSGALSLRLAGDRTLATILSTLPDPFSPQTETDYYRERYKLLVDESCSLSERVKAVHRMQLTQFMRICARNANPETDIVVIGRELSALADSVIGICMDIASDDLSSRSGTPAFESSLAVLGMGKLGGRELNVSSDVDLIYLYRERNDQENGDRIVYHTQLAERLTRLLTEPTELGALYRVDTRLRADGASGPLVRSMRDYFRYLEMRGEAWERQMLLKARPVAGNITEAVDFLRSLDRFIFPSTLTRSPHREIAALKSQIEARFIAEGSKKTHLKLMPGGIRDIEFIAQCLQLLMGGFHPEVRATGTREALDRLHESGALNAAEHETLTRAYALYRRVENALQWREFLPAFTLPENGTEMDEVALFLGYDPESGNPGAALRSELEDTLRRVRAIYGEVFSLGKDRAFAEMSLQTVFGSAGDDAARRFLESLGFPDPAGSARSLARFVSGDAGSGEATLHPSDERFIPTLLGALADLPDPAGALERLSLIVEAYNARHTLFDLLGANPKLFELLVSIAHNSVFLTQILVRDPSLLDWLVEIGEIRKAPDAEEILEELRRIDRESRAGEAWTRASLAVKNREELRVGARAISGLTTTFEAFGELSTIAGSVVKAAFERVFSQLAGDRDNYAFSIIAAGRLGSRMMDFGSDLDLIFVYRNGGENDAEAAARSVRLAQTVLALLTGGGGPNKLYDVDARLRPEGGGSVLAISFGEYLRYLENRASVWERLAMVRARAVAGDPELGADVEEALEGFVYRGPLTPPEVKKIMDIRARMCESSQKRHPGLINVKSGPGGLADIDFTAQAHAVHLGSTRTRLRFRGTPELLEALGRERIIGRDEASSLMESYRFLCDTEKALRIGSGRSVNTVPPSGVELARAARLLGFRNVRKFTKRLEDVLTLTRERYASLLQRLSNVPADGQERE